jgi:putative hydrolase of the HAD superfamily
MRLALFDFDDTLVDGRAVLIGSLRALAERHRLDPASVVELALADGNGHGTWSVLASVLRTNFTIAAPVDELVTMLQTGVLERVRPTAATVAALAALRDAGWRIGIVTNGPQFQEEKLRASGLDRLVDGYAVSDLAGARKPEPAIFAAAAAACGCDGGDGWATELEIGWMVGDSAPADIAGARAAGLRSAWLHLGRRWEDAVNAPDPWIVHIGAPAADLGDLTPDHIVDDIAGAVALMLRSTGEAR